MEQSLSCSVSTTETVLSNFLKMNYKTLQQLLDCVALFSFRQHTFFFFLFFNNLPKEGENLVISPPPTQRSFNAEAIWTVFAAFLITPALTSLTEPFISRLFTAAHCRPRPTREGVININHLENSPA